MRSWFQRFMSGRYGFDQLGGFLCIVSFILVIIGAWVSPVLYWLGLILLIYSYFRVLSRNRSKRYAENLKYLTLQNKVQQVRVPKGRGKISITCPKCHNQFIKKS